jgi:hypothetical protein
LIFASTGIIVARVWAGQERAKLFLNTSLEKKQAALALLIVSLLIFAGSRLEAQLPRLGPGHRW